MDTDKSIAIYWIKRDFRLQDNIALSEALAAHSKVVPLFIMEPSFLSAPDTSAFHVNSVVNSLNDIRENIHRSGGEVFVIEGEAIPTLEKLFAAIPFGYLYSHEEVGTNRTYDRDKAVVKWSDEKGIIWREYPQTGVVRRLKDRDEWTTHWRNFYFQKTYPVPTSKQLAKLALPAKWDELGVKCSFPLAIDQFGFSLTDFQRKNVQVVSETAALQELTDFLYNRGVGYRGGISSPNTAILHGSRLSTHLAWGTVTGRVVYKETLNRIEELKKSEANDAGKWRGSLSSFLSRLHWRDHFVQRFETEPLMEFRALNPAYRNLQYDNDPEFIEAFFAGKTGYPLVDAVMRCLHHTGFINFRMRAMITSFACHTLQIGWREVNYPLAKLFTDYEPGIHIAQLQMQAGVVGINTLRTYNPTKQIIDQDPDCVFIKTWVEELREYTAAQIIDHVTFPLPTYPEALVDWKEASAEMRKKIGAIRRLPETKEISKKVYDKHGSRKKSRSATAKPSPKVKVPKPKVERSGTLPLFE